MRIGTGLLVFALLAPTGAPAQPVSPNLAIVEQWLESDYGVVGRETLPATDALEQAVEQAQSEFGADSAEYGQALARLGAVQALGGEAGPALANLDQAIRILRDTLGLYSPELATPQYLLGITLQAVGDYRAGEEALANAQLVIQRAQGNASVEQLPFIDARARGAHARGDSRTAESLYRFAYEMNREQFGATSPEAITAAVRLGRYLSNVGNWQDAIVLYRGAMDELLADGPDVPAARPLLEGRAHAYLRGGRYLRRAFSMHDRVMDLMAAHPDEFPRDERIEALVDYGDLLTRSGYTHTATDRYLEAWWVAQEGGPAYDHWKDMLARPALVRYVTLLPAEVAAEGWTRVDVAYQVSPEGRPQYVELINDVGSERLADFLRDIFRGQIRFRPRIVDGETVTTPKQTIAMALPAIEAVSGSPGITLRSAGNGLFRRGLSTPEILRRMRDGN